VQRPIKAVSIGYYLAQHQRIVVVEQPTTNRLSIITVYLVELLLVHRTFVHDVRRQFVVLLLLFNFILIIFVIIFFFFGIIVVIIIISVVITYISATLN